MAKRLFDCVLIALTLPLTLPIMLGTALLVRWKLGTPVLFRQQRPGKGGALFTLIKFRSMSDARDASGNLLCDGARLGRFGKILRSTSLDELPELWNVLRGEMSLVGPRPLLVGYLDLYNSVQRRRHEVLPGITGWAQVCGRNALSWESKLALDVWYVDNRSLLLDCQILLVTVARVISGKNIAPEGEATMRPFTGCAEGETHGS